MRIVIVSALALAGCAQTAAVTGVIDTNVYPAVRTAMCALSPAMVEQRRAERYATSGVIVIADCDWRPGDTLADYERRVMDKVR